MGNTDEGDLDGEAVGMDWRDVRPDMPGSTMAAMNKTITMLPTIMVALDAGLPRWRRRGEVADGVKGVCGGSQ